MDAIPSILGTLPPSVWGRLAVLLAIIMAVATAVYWMMSGGGKTAADPKPCPECGEMLPPFARFCRRCGRRA